MVTALGLGIEERDTDGTVIRWRLRPYDLRHTFGSRQAALGAPISDTSRLMGHEGPEITYRYTHTDEETAKRAAKRLDDAVN